MSKTITIQAYEYSELGFEAREAARNWYKETEDDISGDIAESYRYALEELGYPISDIKFSLSYCQGDGMAFYGRVELPEFLAKRMTDSCLEFKIVDENRKTLQELYKELGDGINYIDCNIIRRNCGYRYSHHNTMRVEVGGDYAQALNHGYDGKLTLERFDEVANDLQAWISTDIKDLSRLLEKQGYAEVEYVQSDECIGEALANNDYLFTREGNRSVTL